MDTWDVTSNGGRMKRLWRLWAQALGEKTGESKGMMKLQDLEPY